MPVTTVVDTNVQPETLLDAAEAIRKEIRKHAEGCRGIRAQRQRKAREREPTIASSVDFSVEAGEDVDALCREAATRILEIIEDEAGGEQWKGEVQIIGDIGVANKARVLARVPLTIDGGTPQPKPTRDSEITGVIGALRVLVTDLGGTVVKIANAKGLEHESIANLVASVAKAQSKTYKKRGKWKWKMHKETEKTARETEREHSAASRSRDRWNAFETFAEEYKDVAELWSLYFMKGGKEMPKRPTPEEVEKVFNAEASEKIDGRPISEVFDTIRAIVSEMIAEPDVKRRCALAKKDLKKAINALSKTEQDAMKVRMIMLLGAERVSEISAWLSLPIS